jgi:hypothetical protein
MALKVQRISEGDFVQNVPRNSKALPTLFPIFPLLLPLGKFSAGREPAGQ